MHQYRLTWVAIFSIIVLMFLRLPPMVAKEDSVLNTYRALVEVDALAKQHYVERIDDDRLVDGAIRGMMFQLDPYSGYIAPDELLQSQRRHDGDYIGIGIEVGMPGGRPTVIAAIEGGPAARAGVFAQDRILAVDGRDVEGLSVFDLEHMLEGRPETGIRLTLQHVGSEEPIELTIRRGPVSLTTVRGFRRYPGGVWDYLIQPQSGIGYIRVSNFQRNTMRAFDAALQELVDLGVRGLIIDLRFNPGGILEQAIEMVDRFVEYGVIASTVTRRRAVKEYFANLRGTLEHIELSVLINRGTASAAEIVSGSLQDHGRAVLIGERSFGKGSIQHIMNLTSHEAAIKVTVAYYRLPGGRLIHRTPRNEHTDAWGVKPDIEIVLRDDEVKAIQESRHAIDAGLRTGSPGFAYIPDNDRDAGGGQDASRARPSDAGDAEVSGPTTPRTFGVEILRDRQLNEALSRICRSVQGHATTPN